MFSCFSSSSNNFLRTMGGAQSSFKHHHLHHHVVQTSTPSSSSSSAGAFSNLYKTTNLVSSYESACRSHDDMNDFDSALQARTNHALSSIAGGGIEVRALSFDSLKDVTECLLDMDQQVVKVILECKKDIWRNQELFQLVEEYFDNSLKTLDFCVELEKCLKRARDRQLLIQVAIQQFETDNYEEAIDELKNLKEAGDPFTEDFFRIFRSVYMNQIVMLEKLQSRKAKLDKKLKSIGSWRKVSGIIFAAAFAAVLICSVVAAAVAAPPVAGALAAAASVPLGSMGKWVDSLLKNYEDAMKGQKETINGMQAGTYVSIKDMDTIRVLIDRLEMEMKMMLENADFAIDNEGAGVKIAIGEIKKKLEGFMKNIEDLGKQADVCSRDIRRARTVILQRIIKHPQSTTMIE
ncbi:unnamed protein product [Cuscuta epithymum]|uniref:Uncharacterized protein n=1 Tax=Cuscuta epithymum TaxID=186058 RepID=A0AAV0CPY5_9ASTE|nr:unnamed protein product [Cuscuta epithymum]